MSPRKLRAFLAATALLAVGVACDAPEPSDAPDPLSLAQRIADARIVELTHPVSEETLVWPTSAPFTFETTFEGWTEEGFYYFSRNFAGPEHGGTHLDAPIHFAEGRWTTDQIPLDRLIGPAVVVDVSQEAAADPNYRMTVGDLEGWEAVHGRIPDGAILFVFTDRSRLWPDAEAYMGTAETGEEAIPELSFPGIHPEAAEWIVENRQVAVVGIDTPSLDHGPSTDFRTHVILNEANIPGLENVANLEELPATGAVVFALPLLLEGGSGGPVRIVALVE